MLRGTGSRRQRRCLAALLVAVGLSLAGCESAESRRMRAADTSPGPSLQVELCRKLSRKGKRQGTGHEFAIGEKSAVMAFAEFADLRPGRDYTAHLVWIRPDGREMFRRFAEFSLREKDGGWVADVAWKDALDLNHEKREEIPAASPALTLDTTLNTSRDKERETGNWRLRVYLDRRLVREEAFSLAAFREVPDDDDDGDGDRPAPQKEKSRKKSRKGADKTASADDRDG